MIHAFLLNRFQVAFSNECRGQMRHKPAGNIAREEFI